MLEEQTRTVSTTWPLFSHIAVVLAYLGMDTFSIASPLQEKAVMAVPDSLLGLPTQDI